MKSRNKFIFLRHGKFQLPYKDHSEIPFSMLRGLGLSTLNPPMDAAFLRARIEELTDLIDTKNISHMFVSPSPRCQQTADTILEYLGTIRCTPTLQVVPGLREVHFDLRILNTGKHLEKEILKSGIAPVNTAVFEGMLSGIGCEPISDVHQRVDAVFHSLPSEGNALCITHDFVMRVIELYIRGVSNIDVNTLEKTRRNGYLTGFSTDGTLRAFEPLN